MESSRAGVFLSLSPPTTHQRQVPSRCKQRCPLLLSFTLPDTRATGRTLPALPMLLPHVGPQPKQEHRSLGTQARLGPPGGLIRLGVLPPRKPGAHLLWLQATPSGAPSPEQAEGLLGGTRGIQSAQSSLAHCRLHCGMVLTGEEAKDGTNQKRLFICKGAQTGGRLLDTVASPPTSSCPSSCLAREGLAAAQTDLHKVRERAE